MKEKAREDEKESKIASIVETGEWEMAGENAFAIWED